MPSLRIEPPRLDASAHAPSTARRARFLTLVCAHTSALEAAAHRLCPEPAVAADLIQDTLERAWRHLSALQDDERARPWLMRILRNTWIDQVRRRRDEVPIDDAPEPPAAAADEPLWWERITVEDLRRTITRLEEPYRSVAALHDLDGHSYRDIARRLAIPNATAATRLHRAHARIRALLQRELCAEADHLPDHTIGPEPSSNSIRTTETGECGNCARGARLDLVTIKGVNACPDNPSPSPRAGHSTTAPQRERINITRETTTTAPDATPNRSDTGDA